MEKIKFVPHHHLNSYHVLQSGRIRTRIENVATAPPPRVHPVATWFNNIDAILFKEIVAIMLSKLKVTTVQR